MGRPAHARATLPVQEVLTVQLIFILFMTVKDLTVNLAMAAKTWDELHTKISTDEDFTKEIAFKGMTCESS